MSAFPLPSGHDIYWEKWMDAFEAQQEVFNPPTTDIEEEPEEEGYLNAQWSAEEPYEEETEQFMPVQGIMTPYGVLPLTDDTLASRKFKFWVGHSNFRLTEDYYNVIGATEGVETLDILTPYRFRIGVGRMFIDRNVMSSVRDKMVAHVVKKRNPHKNDLV
jgi:hypothetical protein